jgi:GNAT superfamily N-acetyltransferase
MIYREAAISDIPQLQLIRNAVNENVLNNPALVQHMDYVEYLTERGKGWVCEKDGIIIGFAIADLKDNNIWALFVHPYHEQLGVGKALHAMMLNWYFNQQKQMVWLSTGADTRAEKFYRLQGWKETGLYGKGEIKFEMRKEDWARQSMKQKSK